MMSFAKLYSFFVFGASFVHGVMLLKASLHGFKRKRGGCGGGVEGGAAPPHLQTQRLYDFMTGSERVHMGSVFAGRMMLEATLSFKNCEDNML